jgi:aryl-alcohol dehydrogenase-like predicted oxidoreductase
MGHETSGTSEKFVGEFIKNNRESVVLATKYSNAAPGNDPNAAGNHRKSMMPALEASLKRLQTDYIDLYWVHIWDGITPVFMCLLLIRLDVLRGQNTFTMLYWQL